MRERQALADAISSYEQLQRDLTDNVELIELGEAEKDEGVVAEAEKALQGLHRQAQKKQIETLLSGEADANDTYLEIHAGTGHRC
jgi:peptide chain release factor 2